MIDIREYFGLEGKVALVTGGSKGIGLSTCQYLAAAGATVMLTGRNADALEAAVKLIRDGGGHAVAARGDVADAEHQEEVCRRCVGELGGLHILVNNAADMGPIGLLIEQAADAVAEVIHRDQVVPLLWTQNAWRVWMREHGGSVVNISSFAGLRSRATFGAYGSAKAGLDHMTRVLALELAPTVRVNSVAPGLVLTDMAEANASQSLLDAAARRPMKRCGKPEDIARAVLFLASDASSWITGQVLPVEGGALLTAV